jgi:hypothetical protein
MLAWLKSGLITEKCHEKGRLELLTY